MRRWNTKFRSVNRITRLEIQGLPIQVWNSDSLCKVGGLWGKVVNYELLGDLGFRRTHGFVDVLTESLDWIRDTVKVIIGRSHYKIRVIEKSWDGLELGEIMEAGSEASFLSGSEDRDSEIGGSFGSSSVSSKAQIWNSPVEVAPNSSSTVRRENERTTIRTHGKEELIQDQLLRKEVGDSMGGFLASHDVVYNMDIGAVHKESLDDAGGSNSEADNTLLGLRNQPISSGPRMEMNSGDGLSPPHVTTPVFVSPACAIEEGSEVNGVGSDQLSKEQIEEWILHSKIDAVEKRKKRKKKMKKVKIPCNCYRRKRGLSCKHDAVTGGTVGESFMCDRNLQDSSDSELMIRNSNRRIRAAASMPGISESLPSSVDSRLLDINNLGGKHFNFASINPVGKSAGLITIWNDSLFQSLDVEKKDGFMVVVGTWLSSKVNLGVINVDFNEVRSADERKGSIFDPIGARYFNDFIASVGLLDIHLGGRRDVKAECENLKQKISAIDLLAKTGMIDSNIVNERANLMIRLNEIVANQASDLKQKAKSRWIAIGDENTSFFYGLLNSRRKNSRIHGVNINEGVRSHPRSGTRLCDTATRLKTWPVEAEELSGAILKWLKWVPSKVNIHLWRTLNNRLATKDNLLKRGMVLNSDECQTCLVTAENLDHVFVTCSTAKGIPAEERLAR
ncbi:Reverse transcriptase zinc-binding domain-containing protein [Cynara cardunculus var. scolymus]|uniref:Reverse transcriptase zinc-binding domain-containing protein n=1 Tax=Cynara cardunculus var. scolymus TaxID=59895 RepID=A0A103YA65_CYNCS|nr:Reverse transcriptase zinc-binding domain-containing protein [Cynara cardunculus var. scolymus]